MDMKTEEKKPLPAPLLVPAICWGLGIIIQSLVGIEWIGWLFPLILVLFLIRRLRTYAFLLLIVVTGGYRYQIKSSYSNNVLSRYCDFTTVIKQPVAGVIQNYKELVYGGKSYKIQTDTIGDMPIKAGLVLTSPTDSLNIGDVIRVYAEFSLYEPAMNPGQFDFSSYRKRNGYHAGGAFRSPAFVIGKRNNPVIIRNKIRKSLSDRIRKSFPLYSGFIKAILLGDRNEAQEYTTLFKEAGIMHLLAISGLHTGIIYLFAFFTFRILLPKRTAMLLTIPFLLFFLFICETSPSVLRAVLMLLIFNISRLLERDIGVLQLLSAVFLISTYIDPTDLLSIGFQLSFTAVFVILYLNKALGLIFVPSPKSRVKYLWGFLNSVSVTLMVNIFLLPILFYHFHWASLAGIILSIPAIMIFSLILPWSLFILFLPITSRLHTFLSPALTYAINLLERTASFSDSLHLTLNSIRFPVYLFILYWLIVLFLILSSHLKKKKFISITSICFLLLSLLIVIENYKKQPDLQIICFQVNHGDCHLIRNGDDVTLIDCGGFLGNSTAFEQYVLPWFRENGIRKLTRLILTHPHDDHYGGILPLLDNCRIEEIIVSNNFAHSDLYQRWQKTRLDEGNIVTTTVDSLLLFDTENLHFTLINPDPTGHERNINNQSLITRIEYRDFTTLFCGDLQCEGERILLSHYPDLLDADFLKAGHHGSDNTLSDAFLLSASPYLCYIPVNIKGKTVLSDATLKQLEMHEIETYVSGRDGALIINEHQGRIFGETYYTKEMTYF
jgi:competence protein ComEC